MQGDRDEQIIAKLEKRLGSSKTLKKELERDGLEWIFDETSSRRPTAPSEPKKRALEQTHASKKPRVVNNSKEAKPAKQTKSKPSKPQKAQTRDGTQAAEQPQEQLRDAPKLSPEVNRMLRGLLNRLAEANLLNVASEIEALYSHYSHSLLSETLVSAMLAHCQVPNIMANLVAVNASLVALLTDRIGLEIAGAVLEKFAELFQRAYADSDSLLSSNLLTLLTTLYSFGVIECTLMFDLIRLFLESFAEIDMDLLLLLLKSSGVQLRKDDPSALLEIISLVKKQEDAHRAEIAGNPRFGFTLQAIYDLKNNKLLRAGSATDHLKSIVSANLRNKSSSNHIKIRWQELTSSERKGRWWLVGSAWAVHTSMLRNDKQEPQFELAYDAELLRLAKANRMNTDLKKAVFCVLMSSEDYLDAFEKLSKLGLKDQQEREIVHVLVHCCLQEQSYNVFYAHLAMRLCSTNHNFKFTFQYSFWDRFKQLNSGTLLPHQIANLALLLAELVANFSLSLGVLKALEFDLANAHVLVFLRVFAVKLLTGFEAETTRAVFERICKKGSEKLAKLREDLIHLFARGNLTNSNALQVDKAQLRERIEIARSSLEKASFTFY
jgi:nucleolar MIF4G domain-containing protein 1